MKLIPIIDTEEQCLGVRLGGLKGDHEAIGEFVEFLKDSGSQKKDTYILKRRLSSGRFIYVITLMPELFLDIGFGLVMLYKGSRGFNSYTTTTTERSSEDNIQ